MSHRKGNSYLGGHSLVRVDPVGVSKKRVASRLDKKNSKEDSIRLGNQLVEKLAVIEREKSALRKTIIGNGDRVRLGVLSSGWPTYKFQLKKKLDELHRCKIHGADAIARVLNMQGFKTGSGQVWDARTAKIRRQNCLVGAKRNEIHPRIW
jgi:hypothetical protein